MVHPAGSAFSDTMQVNPHLAGGEEFVPEMCHHRAGVRYDTVIEIINKLLSRFVV